MGGAYRQGPDKSSNVFFAVLTGSSRVLKSMGSIHAAQSPTSTYTHTTHSAVTLAKNGEGANRFRPENHERG
ncbi:hypothetical protein RRG08_047803 [Elysia crispata]|uniref:Uncharacterized protein n=1 Tax=Elysia crispata TaxID=231223 RepID=A0AAE0Y3S8_9GAST|nr:hypothetical protein RRG08_047803 [Elysia crispata]